MELFYKLRKSIARIWSGKNLLAQIFAAIVSVAIVMLNFDGWYFSHVRDSGIFWFFSLAGMWGFFVPVVLFGTLLIGGTVVRNRRTITAAWIVAQAGLLGVISSSFIKIFTGRIPPPPVWVPTAQATVISHGFQFGILRGGVFWGWPSSHTATAFSIAVALAIYYRDKKWVGIIAVAVASYIAIGASFSFHWFSDVVAGLVLGVVIGMTIGRAFAKRLK